jgi:hypothetical protein
VLDDAHAPVFDSEVVNDEHIGVYGPSSATLSPRPPGSARSAGLTAVTRPSVSPTVGWTTMAAALVRHPGGRILTALQGLTPAVVPHRGGAVSIDEQPDRPSWPENLRPGAVRFPRSSSDYDRTVLFYRDLRGLPIVGEFASSLGEDGTIFVCPIPASSSRSFERMRLRRLPTC